MKLNLGCGTDYKEDFINIDIDPRVRPDIVRNVENGLPFSDNTIDEVYTKHFLEHILPDKIHFVMFEIWRVLKKEGRLISIVPINKGWLSSPEHKTPFGESSAIFFTDWNFREPYRFKLISQKTLFLDKSKPETEELHFELEVCK